MLLLTYGTRPEYIKIKPLIDELKNSNIKYKTLFTGQHKDIVTTNADFNLIITDNKKNRLDNILISCLSIPDECFNDITHVLVQGDTTSALGLAITSFNRGVKVIHLEAGLRTYDFKNPYPEEMNRQLISRISNINLCPTTDNLVNLKNELVGGDSYVVGNTVLDNLNKYIDRCEYTNKVLVTLHRRENHEIITKWFSEINNLAINNKDIEFILPIHPNPNVIKHSNLLSNVKIINPLQHNDLLELLIKCKLVITDSGGLQEECSFLNKKCLICREKTERSESIGLTSFIVKTPNDLEGVFNEHINNFKVNEKSPFGDGESSIKIINILKQNYL